MSWLSLEAFLGASIEGPRHSVIYRREELGYRVLLEAKINGSLWEATDPPCVPGIHYVPPHDDKPDEGYCLDLYLGFLADLATWFTPAAEDRDW